MASRYLAFLLLLLSHTVIAQKECSVTSDSVSAPLIAATGYEYQLLAKGLTKPRGIVFDSKGHLLVLESGKGITALTLKDEGPTSCVRVETNQPVVEGRADQPLKLNHGIQLDVDGKRLFVSSMSSVFSFDYNPTSAKTIGTNYTTWVEGMSGSDHKTRTLLLSKKAPGTMLVSRGSTGNMDWGATDKTTGISNIRSFSVALPFQRTRQYTEGVLIGMGLRNSIGMDEHPISGGIWSNENAADDIRRDKIDTHENVPGEEVNFHGYLNGTVSNVTGTHYGYPFCASVWGLNSTFKDASKKTVSFPRKEKLEVGKQFFVGDVEGMLPTGQLPTKGFDTSMLTVMKKTGESDTTCQDVNKFTPPRLTLPPHWAPIDMRFNSKGTVAYMTSHGSWNKDSPDGYQLFAIAWDDKGEPVHSTNSETAAVAILQNKNVKSCSLTNKSCIHPTGLAFSPSGKLYMASDITGEIYVISRKDGKSVDALDSATIDAIGKKQYGIKTSGPSSILKVRKESTWGTIWKMFGAMKV